MRAAWVARVEFAGRDEGLAQESAVVAGRGARIDGVRLVPHLRIGIETGLDSRAARDCSAAQLSRIFGL